jgi:hypothetical protein
MRNVRWTVLLVALLGLGTFSASADPNTGPLPAGPLPAGPESDSQAQILKNQLLVNLNSIYTAKEIEDGVYVGSEFCIACHGGKATWRDTKHAQALRRPMAVYSLEPGKGVVADYDKDGVDDFMQGLDFNQISSVFNPYKPNAPVLSYQGGTYYVSIGTRKMPVVCTQGGTGDWKQRYLLRVPVRGTADGFSAENYVSPIQYNETTDGYVLYHPEAWYDDNNNPRYDAGTTAAELAVENGRTYSKKCIGCHTTGVRGVEQTANGEWVYDAFEAVIYQPDDPGYFDYNHDGRTDIVNVGCEACHGPGSDHILGGGDPQEIANPDDMTTAEANEVCGQCHSRTKSVPNGTHGWPYNDEEGRMWRPGSGEALTDFYTDAAGRWPDGINSKQHHQQYFDFLESSKPEFRFHEVRCTECHASHGGTSNPHLIRDEMVEDGVTIATRNEDNTLCLSCHATHGDFEDITLEMLVDLDANLTEIAEVVSGHTYHPYAPERRVGLSRCTSCHMPTVAKSAVNYDIHSHSFEVIAPQKNLLYQAQGGMPDSCAVSCHSEKANVFGLGITNDIGVWNKAFDRQAARKLRQYFGPGGIWWDTDDGDSVTFENLEKAALPGEVGPVAVDDD